MHHKGIMGACATCERPIYIHRFQLRKGKPRYCSLPCAYAARGKVPLADRFWPKVEKSEGCWLWTAARTPRGYGHLRYRNEYLLAHRASWEIHFGPVPDDLKVLHTCDTPACVRPDHLFLGTSLDNHDDMKAKGRSAKGEKHGGARLTEAQVLEIRARFAAGGISQGALRAMYGITQSHVRSIITRKTWRHLP